MEILRRWFIKVPFAGQNFPHFLTHHTHFSVYLLQHTTLFHVVFFYGCTVGGWKIHVLFITVDSV